MKPPSRNYLADLFFRNAKQATFVAYAIESSDSYDQAMACARFTKQAFGFDIYVDIKGAFDEFGVGLDRDAAWKLMQQAATSSINAYTLSLAAALPASMTAPLKRYDA